MFIVAGEALIDVFLGSNRGPGTDLESQVGGSPLNVARGLARLGRPTVFFGGISNGDLGNRIFAALRADRVDLRAVHRSDAPTTISVVEHSEGTVRYSFYGEGAADTALPLEALQLLPSKATALHVGSYSMVTGETAQTQRALVERERGRLVISYDPNVRTRVEPNLSVWRETLKWIAARASIVKVSDEDLETLYPGAEPGNFSADCLAAGADLVVVTRGSEGAYGWCRRGQYIAQPVQTAVVDTVGAGDTFQAALLCRLDELGVLTPDAMRTLHLQDLSEAMRFASAAASMTCGKRGADMPRRIELESEFPL